MIRYALRCEAGHGFESWFQSAAAFDALAKAGQLACPDCGSPRVAKALMAPAVGAEREAPRAGPAPAKPEAPAAAPSDGKPDPAALRAAAEAAAEAAAQKAIAKLRAKVESEATYVGGKFAEEARAIHAGETPERQIWGEAKPAEARKLIEDGVPVAPLPFTPRRKMN